MQPIPSGAEASPSGSKDRDSPRNILQDAGHHDRDRGRNGGTAPPRHVHLDHGRSADDRSHGRAEEVARGERGLLGNDVSVRRQDGDKLTVGPKAVDEGTKIGKAHGRLV